MNETINDVLRKDYDSCVKRFKKSEKKIEKLEKENQRLKEEYIMLQNASEEYEDKLLKEKQRLNNVLNEIKIIMDDYYAYDYEDENLERLNVIDKINSIVFNELKESDK